MITVFLKELSHHLQTLTWQSVILTAIAGLFAWIVYQIIREKLSPLSKIPSAPGRIPFFGNFFTLMKSDGLHIAFREWEGKRGPIITFKLPGFNGKYDGIDKFINTAQSSKL